MPEIEVVDIDIRDSVISFSETYDGPNGAQLLAYWRALKGDKERAAWKDFDFMEVYRIAPFLIVKDVLDGGVDFRNRYWGTEFWDQDGFDATGKTVTEYYEPKYVDEVIGLYRLPLHNPTPMVMRGRMFYQEPSEWKTYSAVCVGFTGEDGEVSTLAIAYDE